MTKKLKFEDASTFVYGKVPSQAIPLEEAVLGALLIDNRAYEEVEGILSPQSFYLDAHTSIYEAMSRLVNKYAPIDLLTVTEELKRMNALELVGGPFYLVELTNKVASSANIQAHAKVIQECFLKREVVRIGNSAIQKAYDDSSDVFELIDATANQVMALEAPYQGQRSYDGDDLAMAELERIDAQEHSTSELLGVPTGFSEMDKAIMGWEPENAYVIAARPGMGKTALMLNIAETAALDYAAPIGIFSLEMSRTQLTQRMGAKLAQIPLEKVRMSSKMTQEERGHYRQQIQRLAGTPFLVDDTPAVTLAHIRRRVREWKKKYPDLKGIIIDYLQLMGGEGNNRDNREQEVSKVSKGLKALAKEQNIFVIELAQLSRAVETRGGSKRPQLSDLRESGSIEMDADMVSFIYRPEYYGILEDEQGRSLKGVVELIIAKNRHGKLGTIKLKADLERMTFSTWTEADYTEKTEPKLPQLTVVRNPFSDDTDIPF